MRTTDGLEPLSYRACVIGIWLSLIAVIYITLLPFTFIEGHSFSEGWNAYWGGLKFSELWGSNRDQWLFNLLIFTPLGFFSAAWLTWGVRSAAVKLFGAATAALIALAVTVGVEFFQQWLPYRAPAMADIAGNFSGGVLGAIGWFMLRDPLGSWLEALGARGVRSLRMGVLVYSVGYVIVGLLPFNLILTPGRLLERLDSSAVVLWRSSSSSLTGLAAHAELGLEVLAAMPVGLALVAIWPRLVRRPILFGLPAALFSGVLLECVDIISASGIFEGRSAVLRSVGMGGGVVFGAWLANADNNSGARILHGLRSYAWAVLLICTPLYMLLLVKFNFGFNPNWDLSGAWERLRQTSLVPFYYHYHVSELHALRSIVLHLALYAPVGAGAWLIGLRIQARRHKIVLWAAMGAAFIALIMEAGQMALPGERVDTATVLLAAVAAAVLAVVGGWVRRVANAQESPDKWASTFSTSPYSYYDNHSASWGALIRRWLQIAGGALILLVTALAMSWPVAPGPLTLGLISYALLLWRYPLAWLWVLPGLVPILDWTLWTGWLHFAEIDLFLLATLSVTLLRDRWPQRGPLLPRAVSLPLVLLVVSTLISLGLALWPLPDLNPGLLSHYATGWNGLRVATGLLGALILLIAMRAAPESLRKQLESGLVPGMGLAWLVCAGVILRERAIYPGLLDFDGSYRVSGWFADMHVGGPSVESFLLLSMPFAMLWAWRICGRLLRVISVSLVVLLGSYLLLVTYSRASLLGLAVGLLVMSLAVLLARSSDYGTGSASTISVRAALAALPLVIAGTMAYTLIGNGQTAERWSALEQGVQGRVDHWQAAMRLAQNGGSILWGRGLGAFAEDFRYVAAARGDVVPENFEFIERDSFGALRLGAGGPLYINQRLRVPRDQAYRLSLKIRGAEGSHLDAYVCEKPVRHSFTCRSKRFEIEGGSSFSSVDWSFDMSGFDQGKPGFQRGLVLSLAHAGGTERLVDIDSVQLFDSSGRGYLRNPDFMKAGQNWYFTTDNLWPYRTENQWLEVYYDQGLFGVVVFSLFLLAVMAMLMRRFVQGDILVATCLAALLGVLAVGVFHTIFFNPKIALVFYLVALLGAGHIDRVTGNREMSPRGW